MFQVKSLKKQILSSTEGVGETQRFNFLGLYLKLRYPTNGEGFLKPYQARRNNLAWVWSWDQVCMGSCVMMMMNRCALSVEERPAFSSSSAILYENKDSKTLPLQSTLWWKTVLHLSNRRRSRMVTVKHFDKGVCTFPRFCGKIARIQTSWVACNPI